MEHTTEPPSVGFGYQDYYPQRLQNEHSSIRSSIRSSNEVPKAPYQGFQAYQVQSQDLPLPPGPLYYRSTSPIFGQSTDLEDLQPPNGHIFQQPQHSSKHYSFGQASFQSRASTPINDKKRLTGLIGINPSASASSHNQDMTWPLTPATMTPI